MFVCLVFYVSAHVILFRTRAPHTGEVANTSESSVLAKWSAAYSGTQIVRFIIYLLRLIWLNLVLICNFLISTCSDNPGLHTYVHLPPKSPAYDLLSKMLEYAFLWTFANLVPLSCIFFWCGLTFSGKYTFITYYYNHKIFCRCWPILHGLGQSTICHDINVLQIFGSGSDWTPDQLL